jgi:hypothetical protein
MPTPFVFLKDVGKKLALGEVRVIRLYITAPLTA